LPWTLGLWSGPVGSLLLLARVIWFPITPCFSFPSSGWSYPSHQRDVDHWRRRRWERGASRSSMPRVCCWVELPASRGPTPVIVAAVIVPAVVLYPSRVMLVRAWPLISSTARLITSGSRIWMDYRVRTSVWPVPFHHFYSFTRSRASPNVLSWVPIIAFWTITGE
jgi:hypothetical protein